MHKKEVFTIMIVCFTVIGFAIFSCSQNVISHDYYDNVLDYWTKMSADYFDDDIFHSYQCALRADYYGTGDLVTIANFYHGHVGIFKETDYDKDNCYLQLS